MSDALRIKWDKLHIRSKFFIRKFTYCRSTTQTWARLFWCKTCYSIYICKFLLQENATYIQGSCFFLVYMSTKFIRTKLFSDLYQLLKNGVLLWKSGTVLFKFLFLICETLLHCDRLNIKAFSARSWYLFHFVSFPQITVIHIKATAKNAADDKLKQHMQKFGQTFNAPATVLLISGDVNFAPVLHDLRYTSNFKILLLHNVQASQNFVQFAHEAYRFDLFIQDLPDELNGKPAQVRINLLG